MSTLLSVDDLHKEYRTQKQTISALNGVSFDLATGETIGLVGESGCGKTTLAKALLRLVEPTRGRVVFKGVDLTALSARQLRMHRKHLQYVFQSPYTALNPAMSVQENITRGLIIHAIVPRRLARSRAAELLESLNVDPEQMDRFPHEFSGGQRQRVAIARALAVEPALVVLDEPTSSLDVSVQAQILNRLRALQEERGFAFVFITHDLTVAKHMSHRIGIMYAGHLVEVGSTQQVFQKPEHPYTAALLASIPPAHPHDARKRLVLRGEVPDPGKALPGCPFHPRCPRSESRCEVERPLLTAVATDHSVACHIPLGSAEGSNNGVERGQR